MRKFVNLEEPSYTSKDIRVGSIVKAPGKVGITLYKVTRIGTKLLGDDSFLGTDLQMPPVTQILSCSLIEKIVMY